MAKKALINKQRQTPKFKVRVHAASDAVDRTPSTASSASAESVYVTWFTPGRSLA